MPLYELFKYPAEHQVVTVIFLSFPTAVASIKSTTIIKFIRDKKFRYIKLKCSAKNERICYFLLNLLFAIIHLF